MSQHWPHSDHAYAAPMNALPKLVFSRTLNEARWETSRIAKIYTEARRRGAA